VNEGHLLPRFTERVYGVVTHDGPEGVMADGEATSRRREELRRQRAERAIPVSEWLAKTRERVMAKDFVYPVTDMYRESMDISDKWAAEFQDFWDLPEDFGF
jgi:acetone carboxylase, alpha subunit